MIEAAPLVLIDVVTDQGVTGHSYIFAYTKLTLAPLVHLIEEIGRDLTGKVIAPFDLMAVMDAKFRLLGWQGLVGMAVILGIALALSKNRRAIRWRTIGWAFVLQLAFAFLVLYWEQGKNALEAFSNKVSNAIGYADRGSGFLFGWLAGPMDTLGEKTGMPLAGFIFSRDQKAIDRFIGELSFGGGGVNLVNVHLFVETMPFGGTGTAGMGHYYGKYGFDALTHAKSMLISPPNVGIEHLYSPFTDEKNRALQGWFEY